MIRAVFLDRDGTIIKGPTPPKKPKDIVFVPGSIAALTELRRAGFLLFLVSNQPDVAKGNSTMEELQAVHLKFKRELEISGIHFREFYYCYHREEDHCFCRKPSPLFLIRAKEKYDIDLTRSWMVGDSDKDIHCGVAAGTKTYLVDNTNTLTQAVKRILEDV